jgi:hypothetical protein
MADYTGELCKDGYRVFYGTSTFSLSVQGYQTYQQSPVVPGLTVSAFGIAKYLTYVYGNLNGYTSYTGGGGTTSTTHYYKRAWDITTSSYTYWTTTVINDSYSGSDTVTPTTGVVIYSWVTTP